MMSKRQYLMKFFPMLESLREVCLPCLLVVEAVVYFRNQNDPLLACNMTRLKVDMRTSEEECRVAQNNFFRQTTWRSVVQCLQLQK